MTTISRGPTLSAQVYSYVRDRIVNGEYRPGEALVESEIAAELHVSRTPVSNAIIMCKERGLLEDQGGKPSVPRLSLKDVTDLYRCRLALDALACRMAAETITERDLKRLEREVKHYEAPVPKSDRTALWVADLSFHATIYQASGNRHLMRFAQITSELASVYQRSTFRKLGSDANEGARTHEDIRREHQRILDALIQRDADRAEQAAIEHIESVIRHLNRSEVFSPEGV